MIYALPAKVIQEVLTIVWNEESPGYYFSRMKCENAGMIDLQKVFHCTALMKTPYGTYNISFIVADDGTPFYYIYKTRT